MANISFNKNPIEELTNVTTLTNETFSFIWKIEHFAEFMSRKYEFPSPMFCPKSAQETGWRMVVFPENIYPEGAHVALRLLKVSDDTATCSVVYKISLIDGYGKYFLKQTREKVFQNNLDFDECSVISCIELKEKKLLPNGSLTVSCEIDLVAVNNHDRSSSLAPPNYDSILKLDLSPVANFDKSQADCTRSKNTSNSNHLRCSSIEGSKPEKDQQSIELLSDDFKSLYMSRYQTDVIIHIDDGELRGHRAILAARSEYFKQAMPQFGGSSDIYIPEIKRISTLDAVLYYLYSGRLRPLTYTIAIDLLTACKILSLEKLQNEVIHFLKSQITVNNVTDILRISKEMKMDALKNCALKFVSVNHTEVAKTQKWNEMTKNDPRTAGEVLLTVAAFQNPHL